jgi:hypothetical protein
MLPAPGHGGCCCSSSPIHGPDAPAPCPCHGTPGRFASSSFSGSWANGLNMVSFSPFALRGCAPDEAACPFSRFFPLSWPELSLLHHGSLRRDRSDHNDTALGSFTPAWISQATFALFSSRKHFSGIRIESAPQRNETAVPLPLHHCILIQKTALRSSGN